MLACSVLSLTIPYLASVILLLPLWKLKALRMRDRGKNYRKSPGQEAKIEDGQEPVVLSMDQVEIFPDSNMAAYDRVV